MFKNYSSKFNFSQNLNDIENDNLGKVHGIYMGLKMKIRNAKNRLNE